MVHTGNVNSADLALNSKQTSKNVKKRPKSYQHSFKECPHRLCYFSLTLTHCLGGNRSHSTREDVYFVDEVLVDFADRGQTCVVKLVVVYKIRSLQARNDSGTVSSRHRSVLGAT